MRIKIISNGHPSTTRVVSVDNPADMLEGVVAVRWGHELGGVPRAHLVMVDVPVEIEADVHVIEREPMETRTLRIDLHRAGGAIVHVGALLDEDTGTDEILRLAERRTLQEAGAAIRRLLSVVGDELLPLTEATEHVAGPVENERQPCARCGAVLVDVAEATEAGLQSFTWRPGTIVYVTGIRQTIRRPLGAVRGCKP